VELGERLVALQAQDAGFLDTLAACYAEAGRFEEAIEAEERALELSAAGAGAERDAMQARLELYRQGRPFRDG
jgi:Flp pilus assembly protein TadD